MCVWKEAAGRMRKFQLRDRSAVAGTQLSASRQPLPWRSKKPPAMHCQNRFHRFWSRCLRGSPQRRKRLASVKQQIQETSIRSSNGGPEFTGAHLAERGYWDERYTKTGGRKHFDWLASGDTTLDLILPYLRPGAKVLDLGCGTSSFALQLARVSPVPVQVSLLPLFHLGFHVVFTRSSVSTILEQLLQL